ncbi:MAG: hypothetical protein ACREN8_04470 [Candidatus Dormibacteraceae bacterium]
MRLCHDVAGPRAIAARIKAETEIDLLDSRADAAAAAMRRAGRQIAGTFGASLAGTMVLICIVLAFAHGNASMGLRAAFALGGVALAAAGTVLTVLHLYTDYSEAILSPP